MRAVWFRVGCGLCATVSGRRRRGLGIDRSSECSVIEAASPRMCVCVCVCAYAMLLYGPAMCLRGLTSPRVLYVVHGDYMMCVVHGDYIMPQ